MKCRNLKRNSFGTIEECVNEIIKEHTKEQMMKEYLMMKLTSNQFETLKLAICMFGEEKQEQVAIEECAELIKAICNKHRGRPHNIAEEIADVEIMLEQLKIINECFYDTAKIKNDKIERLYHRLMQINEYEE